MSQPGAPDDPPSHYHRGGKGGNGNRGVPPLVIKFEVIHWSPDQAEEDDANLESRLKLGLPEKSTY